MFDSSWELAFYLYHKDKNFNIKKPQSIEYYDEIGGKHKYFPDFEIDGVLYEIKGSQFLNNSKYSYFKSLTGRAKLQLIQKLGIIMIKKDEIQFYLKYAREKYGDLKKFKMLKQNLITLMNN